MNRLTIAPRHISTLAALIAVGAFASLLPSAAADQAAPAARSAGSTRPPAARTVVDPAVRPAGHAACRDCGPGGCRHGKVCHHRDCRDGVCVPYCPVRPGTFGYYNTQWRRWPGQGVVPVSNVEAVTPVKPPKSEVPGIDEESFGPKPDDLPEPVAPESDGSAPAPRPMPPEPSAGPGDAATAPEPAAPQPADPAPEPRAMPLESAEPPSQPATEATPPAKPKTNDLFDESAARKVRRKIPVQASDAPRPTAGGPSGVKPASHEGARASSRSVPRVAFDPQAETARLRPAR